MGDYEVIGVSRGNGGGLEHVTVRLETPQGPREDAAPINRGNLDKALLAVIMRAMGCSVPADPGWIFEELGASLQAKPATAYELFAPSARTYSMCAIARVRTPTGRLYQAEWEGETHDHLKAMAIVVLSVFLQHKAASEAAAGAV